MNIGMGGPPNNINGQMPSQRGRGGGIYEGVNFGMRAARGGWRGGANNRGSGFRGGI